MTNSYDEIRLVGLGGFGYHGVLAAERDEGQPFHADVVVYLDTSGTAKTDDLTQTVDYAAVAKAVIEVIEGEPANLIETVAARIADAVLAFGAAKVDVTLHKPQAPLGVPFSDVNVRISRTAPTGASMAPAGAKAAQLPGPADDQDQPSEPELVAESDVVESGETGAAGETISAGASLDAVAAGAATVGAEAPAAEPDGDGPSGVGPVPPPAEREPGSPEPVLAGAPADLLDDNEGVPEGPRQDLTSQLRAAPDQPVDVVLALGGNDGDVRSTLRQAVQDLREVDELTITEVSALARTAPVVHDDGVGQKDYLNAVILARTSLSPLELLALIHSIEDKHGRVRVQRWGERTLDIDIITYGELTSDDPEVTLPHPLAGERAFVLVPWVQVDPHAVLPGAGAVAELAETAPDRDGVRWLALDWLEEPQEPKGPTQASPEQVNAEPEAAEPALDQRKPIAPAIVESSLPPEIPEPSEPVVAEPDPSSPREPEEVDGPLDSGFVATSDAPGQPHTDVEEHASAPVPVPPEPVAPVAPAPPAPVAPASPAARGEDPPGVMEWLSTSPEAAPAPDAVVEPALPIEEAAQPHESAPEAPVRSVESDGDKLEDDEPEATSWIPDEESAPQLSVSPQWAKVRPPSE